MSKPSATGTDLYSEVHGTTGDPTVLIHGSWVDHRTWDLVVPGLSQAMQVVVYDRRGHGQSAARPRSRPVRDDAADLADLLESLDLFPAHVIAHSYGGAVALRLAIDHPEMVRSLSIHEPPFVGLLSTDPASAKEADELIAAVRRLQTLVRSGKSQVAAEQFVNFYSTEPGEWDRVPTSVREILYRNAPLWAEEFDDPEALTPDRAACRELMVPTLLTTGSQSPRFLHRVTRGAAELLRNCVLQEIRDAGHAPHRAHPDQYVGILVNFLLERNVPTT